MNGGLFMFSQFWTSQSLVKSLYSDCMEATCRKYCLTRMEFDVLMFLANNPQFTTAKDIVENRRMTKSHVSLAVNSLAEKGYIKKYQTEHNHKTIHLSICESASDIIREGRKAQKNFASVLFQGFTSDDCEKMNEFFEKITNNIQNYFKQED